MRDPWPVGHDLDGDARDEWWGFRLTVATSALGLPGVAVPLGRDDAGRPLAVQLLGARWQEPTLASASHGTSARSSPSASSIVSRCAGSRGVARRSRRTTALQPAPTDGAISRGT